MERPHLVTEEKTVLQLGMVFAMDGSLTNDTVEAQIVDSFIVSSHRYEQNSDHPKNLAAVVL